MKLDEEVIEAYKQFIFDCTLIDHGSHDGRPSVNVQVDSRMLFNDSDGRAIGTNVKVHIYTGRRHYELTPAGQFKFNELKEANILEMTVKDVCELMIEDGSFDAMITMYEF